MSDAKTRLPMMPFFVSDYIGATRHMSPAERGVFFDLICFQWILGPLPSDPAKLAMMVGCPLREFKKLWRTVHKEFVSHPDGLINPYFDAQRVKSLALSEERRKAGREGGRASAAKRAATDQGTLQ